MNEQQISDVVDEVFAVAEGAVKGKPWLTMALEALHVVAKLSAPAILARVQAKAAPKS